MDSLPVIKLAVQLVSSVGVSKVVHDIIRLNTTAETTADVVKVIAGSVVIGSMVADHASKHVNDRIDAVVAWNEARKNSEVPDPVEA